MRKIYLFPMVAALITCSPVMVFAQEAEPDPGPVELTIGYSVTSPTSSSFDKAPTEFKLDFSVSSLQVIGITLNSEVNAYVEYQYSNVTMQSAPLTATVNTDKTVTLTADYSKTPELAALLNADNFYSLTLIIPKGIATVSAKNIVNNVSDYTSLEYSRKYVHTGNASMVTFNVAPNNETVERIQNITLTADMALVDSYRYVISSDIEPIIYRKAEGNAEWEEFAYPTINFEGEITAKINVRPIITTKGQYRIDLPLGTFTITGYDLNGKVAETYISDAISIRLAIGEEIAEDGRAKDSFLATVAPAEGSINLTDYPSGVEYLQLIFTELPEINRTIGETVKLYYNGGETPIKEVNPINETVFRLQTQGIQNEYGNMLNLWFDYGESNIDMPGDYVVEFPAGLFTFGELREPNKAFKLNYHIDKVLSYSVYPKNQTVIDAIETISLTFGTATSVRVNPENNEPITLTSTSTSPVRPVSVDCEGKVARINFDKITEYHVYTINIPNGYFLADVDNEELVNQPLSFEYTVSLLPIPEIIPAPGVLPSNQVYEFTLDLGEDAEITGILDNKYNRLLKINDDGEIQYTPVVSYYKYQDPINAVGSSLVTLIPTSETPLTLEPGNYVLLTTRYLYTLKGGDQCGEYFYYFTVLPELPIMEKPVVDPNENVESASLFTMTFNENITSINSDFCFLYPKNEDGTLGEAVATFVASKGTNAKTVDLTRISGTDVPAGIYELQTPKGLCRNASSISGNYSFDIYFGMSGVESINEPSSLYEVYTLEGIRVLHQASSSDLQHLSKGFYIINGKKTIIR